MTDLDLEPSESVALAVPAGEHVSQPALPEVGYTVSLHAHQRLGERAGISGVELAELLTAGACLWLEEPGKTGERFAMLFCWRPGTYIVAAVSPEDRVVRTVLTLNQFMTSHPHQVSHDHIKLARKNVKAYIARQKAGKERPVSSFEFFISTGTTGSALPGLNEDAGWQSLGAWGIAQLIAAGVIPGARRFKLPRFSTLLGPALRSNAFSEWLLASLADKAHLVTGDCRFACRALANDDWMTLDITEPLARALSEPQPVLLDLEQEQELDSSAPAPLEYISGQCKGERDRAQPWMVPMAAPATPAAAWF